MSDFYACLLGRETQVQISPLPPGLFAKHIIFIFTNVCSIHMRTGKYSICIRGRTVFKSVLDAY